MENLQSKLDQKYPQSQLILKIKQYLKQIQQDLKFLQQFHLTVSKIQTDPKYPIKALLKQFQKFIKKIQTRLQKGKTTISDILYIQGPDFLIVTNSLKQYCNHYKSGKDIQQFKQLSLLVGTNEKNQKQLLQFPIQKISDLLNKKIKHLTTITKQQNWLDNQNLIKFINWYQYNIKNQNKWINLLNNIQQKKYLILSQFKLPKNKSIDIKYGLKIIFFNKLKKRVKIAQKNLQKRKMKILQLIDGQKKYVANLKQYIQYIKNPIQKLEILSQDQTKKIFSTISQITQFHQQLHQKLLLKYNKYDKYQIYGDIIGKDIPFFKLYVDYIYNVNQGSQTDFMKLQKNNPKIAQICKIFLQKKQKKASDQLSQPTFRIARYQALFNGIIDKTNPSHPDYIKMTQARNKFLKILGGVNQTVDKVLRKNKLNQLQQQFGTNQNPIYDQSRQYLNQFQMYLIRDNNQQQVTILILSNLILIIDKSRRLLKRIIINDKYYVKRQQDSKIYMNILKIHSDGFTTLSAGNQQRHIKKLQQIYALLQKISPNKMQSQLVYVQALGTQQIGSTSFAKYTQYIVQIKYLEIKKLLHLRFSDMTGLVIKVKQYYKCDLNITQQQTLKKTWFNNHKTKTIQDRKRTIQQILQKMLNHQQVRKQPRFVLSALGIDPDFFNLAKKSMKKSMILNQQSQLKNSSLTKRQQKQAIMILCMTEIKLGRDTYHDQDHLNKRKQHNSKKITIQIKTMADQPAVKVNIFQHYTVQDVCNKVSKLIGLRTNRDFRLFHQIGKKELRVLEHQQVLMKIFKFPDQNQNTVGVFSSITSSLKKIVSPQTQPTLIFKKYYFLPQQIQNNQCKRDLTRLRLLVYQVFAEIKQMKYQLAFDQYILFIAMLIYIQTDGRYNQIQVNKNIIHRIIPQTIFKLKNYTEEQWLQRAQSHLKRLDQQIKKIISVNTQHLRDKKLKIDSASKTALYFGPKHLCSRIVLNKIKSNPIYGSNLFYVQPYKTLYDQFVKQGKKIAYNMWLAIKFDSLTLLTPSSKQQVLQLHYKDIEKVTVYSQAVVFKMDSHENIVYRLNTYQSFEISQLVKYNKALNSVLDQMKMDSGLVSKAKLYKQDIMVYRSTYDKPQISQISD